MIAAALVATYPPLIAVTGDLLSEPLGALWLTAAFVALARRRYALAGLLLAAAVLTRANLLVLVPVLALALGPLAAWCSPSPRSIPVLRLVARTPAPRSRPAAAARSSSAPTCPATARSRARRRR